MKKRIGLAGLLLGLLVFGISIHFNSTSQASAFTIPGEDAPWLSRIRQLTFVGARAGEGYFSADGNQMIYQSERDAKNPFYEMYLTDLRTGKSNRLSPGIGKATCGWLAPDGKHALFASSHLDPQALGKQKDEMDRRASGKPQSYAWDFDENYSIFLADLTALQSDGSPKLTQLTHERGYNAEGAMSPDGQWVVFTSNRYAYDHKLTPEEQKLFDKDPSIFAHIYIVHPDGTGLQQLTTEIGYNGGPFFSPDGNEIAYRHFQIDGRHAEIYTVALPSNGLKATPKKITDLGAMSWSPYYHPSGDYIIFASNFANPRHFELFIVDREGKHAPVRVTEINGFEGLPVFTPDGRHLSWSSLRNQPGHNAQIFVGDWNDARARQALGITKTWKSEMASPFDNEAPLITIPTQYQADVDRLASPDTEGRLTGSAGLEKARQLIAERFKELALEPAGDSKKNSFLDPFDFRLLPNSPVQKDSNVIGRMRLAPKPASGADRPVIVIGAHLDHLGHGEIPYSRARDDEKGQIHAGADDNASGVAGLLAIAGHFWQLQQDDRLKTENGGVVPYDLLFVAWSGEEIGVVGSTHFADERLKGANHDLDVVAYLNMDMIGRLRESLFLQGAGSAAQWREIIENNAIAKGWPSLVVSDDPYLPTDAMPMYVGKAPVLAAFTDIHDEYHTPRDVAALVNPIGGAMTATVLADLIKVIESKALRLSYLEVPPPKMSTNGRKIYLGTIPEYGGVIQYGLKLSGVQAGSPAQKAGLQAKDIVIKLGVLDVRSIQDYVRAINELKADVETEIVVIRGDDTLKLKITPTPKK